MRIRTLLVDDSPETLEALMLLYTSNPEMEVVGTATNAVEAVTFLESTSIDLISIDIYLGDDNGFHLCTRIHHLYPSVFIAMCSLEDDEVYKRIAEQAGARYFLSKPITLDDIWNLIHDLRQFQGGNSERADLCLDDLNDSEWIVRILGAP